MRVVNIADTGIFRALGKPPNPAHDALRQIVREETRTVIRLPRPIYRELGGDLAADHPSGSDYVDSGIREGWIEVADPIEEKAPVSDAVADARAVMKSELSHPKTAVFEEDLSLIGLTVQLFDRAETIHVNLFTTDQPLRKAAAVVVQYYGFYDFDVYYAAPQNVCTDLIRASNFTASYPGEW